MASKTLAVKQTDVERIVFLTLLVGAAYLPLVVHLATQVSAYVGLLIALRLASLRWPALAPGRWKLLPLTLAGGLNVFNAYHSLVGQDGGTALLATMLALKLLETHTERDIRLGTTLFGFLLVSQFLFDQSPLLAFYLFALLIVDIALMVDLTERAANKPARSALRVAGRLMLQALPLALVVYLLFPRLSAPLWSLPQPADRAMTGVKDWLEPGSISELVLSGKLAFRVRFDADVPPQDKLYWRGPVIWATNGRRWEAGQQGRLKPYGQSSMSSSGERISYQVVLEPTGQRWLFALDLPIETPTDAKVTSDFQVLARKRIDSAKGYRMVSAPSYHTGELDPEEELAGLQLPDNVTDRMRALVARWQDGAQGADEILGRGLRYFNEEPFHYTLLPPKLGRNPADEFLFETRQGFCEHYATSFALLMRIAGIPSRIVLGYLGGELNPIGDHLVVRQSDAHAWVEIWLQGRGWVRIDPTAAVDPSRVDRSSFADELAAGTPYRFRVGAPGMLVRWVHNLRLLADALDAGWQDWVLGFSLARQQRMLDTLGLGFLREYGLALAMIVAAGVVLAILVAAMSREQRPRDALERLYSRFCSRLDRVGLPRRGSEGPLDFSRRVVAARPDLRSGVEAFIRLYLPLRYGRRRTPEQVETLRRYLRRFRPQRRSK